MNIFAISGILIALVFSFLTVLVFAKNRERIHLIWGAFCVTVVLWGIGCFIIGTKGVDKNLALWGWKVGYSGVIFIPVFFTHFVYKFLGKKQEWFIASIYAIGTYFFLNNIFGNQIVGELDYVFNQFYYLSKPTLFYNLFVTFFLSLMTYSHALLLLGYLSAIGIKKVHVKNVFIATIVGFLGGSLDFLPVYGIYAYPFLNLSIVFTGVVISYAIFRHRLMGIRFVIRLGTIYAVLFSAVIFAYVFSVSLLSRYIPGVFAFIIPSIIITLGFIPLKNFVETVSDKIFFRKHYRFPVVVTEVEKIIHSAGLNMDKILANFNKLIVDSLRVNKSAVLILIPKDHFVSRQVIGESVLPLEIKFDNPIVSYLNLYKDDILELNELRESENADKKIIKEEMEKTGFSLAVPVKAKDVLVGIYLLGEKLSQDQYEKEDIDLLKHVCGEVGFAIDNARMFEELKVLDKTKSEFISVVSHQMRTPISIIRWNLEMVTEGEVPAKDKDRMLEAVHDRIIFLGYQIDQMLTALEIEERKLSVDKKQADPNSLVEKSIKDAEKEAKIKDIKLKAYIASPALTFDCDAPKIEMVLKVIINNAITYASVGSEVVISSSLKSFGGGENFSVSIADNGIGINDTDRANVFKKFFRSEAAKRTSPNGLGLGLFISKKFIEAHGGNIWVESAGEGKGSIFNFSIPVK